MEGYVYFCHEKVSEHITRIFEGGTPGQGVCFYLVEGEDKIALLDTGFGVGNLREYVEANFAPKPVIVIITHCHIDHVNGAGWWKDIYLNPADNKLYEEAYRPERRKYEDFKGKPAEKIPYSEYAPKITWPFIPYYDGDEFDLGGVHLKAIQVAGHSDGMTCILIKEDRYILLGDACGNQVGIGGDYKVSIPRYKQQLMKIKAIEDQYDNIIRSHTGYWSPKELVDNILESCDLIMAHKDAHIRTERHGRVRYWAWPMNEKRLRADGKAGNLSYEVVDDEQW